jgi:hypothetical protein
MEANLGDALRKGDEHGVRARSRVGRAQHRQAPPLRRAHGRVQGARPPAPPLHGAAAHSARAPLQARLQDGPGHPCVTCLTATHDAVWSGLPPRARPRPRPPPPATPRREA